MSEPEIARRCPTCGASIREVALFCPQCGNAQPQQKSTQSQPGIADAPPETTSKDTAPLEESEVQSSRKVMSKTPETVAISQPEEPSKVPGSAGARGMVGAKLQRATTRARGVEGDVIHRVQRVRRISHVVLDEAGDDPGLRFLLVAVIVFVLFLVIVLLNKFIT